MGKRLVGLVVVLCVAIPMWGGGSAGATAQAHAPKFVGTYRVTVNVGSDSDRSKWAFSADGHVDQDPRATWSNTGNTITVNAYAAGNTEIVLVGTKSGKGINSKRHPGDWYYNDTKLGTWYAVKLS